MLSKIDMIRNDTCCNIVNNINFISTNSNIILLNSGFVSNFVFTSNSVNESSNIKTFNAELLCKPDTNLKTNISANAIHFCKGSPIQFVSNSTIGNVTYQWNFGDPSSGSANTSDLQNPIHIFSNEGNYLAYLIYNIYQ